MRPAWLLVTVLAGGPAAARPTPETCTTHDRPSRFWRDVVDPHAERVCVLLNKAAGAMKQPDDALARDEDWAVEQRARFYRIAYDLMVHARTLSPENPEVLARLARAADELGKTREAVDALEAALRVTGVDKADWTVTGRLGMIRLRLGDADAAIRWLRLAQAPTLTDDDELAERAHMLVHLANALAARGQIAAALHTLSNAVPDRARGNVSYDTTLVTFALAVIYDRDEQRASAFEVLERMQSGLQGDFRSKVQSEIARFRFTPAEDLHYFRAFLYESLGQYVEARAEWALYAAAGNPPWRARALDHLAAIDAQRRTPQQKSEKLPAPPPAIPRRLPRP